MQIVLIVAIQIPALAASFTDRPEGDFAQTPQLAQDGGVGLLLTPVQMDLLAIRRLAQTFAGLNGPFERRPRLGEGDRRLGAKQRRLATSQPIQMLAKALGQGLQRQIEARPGGVGDAGADA